MPDKVQPHVSTLLYDEPIKIDQDRSLRLYFDLGETLVKAAQYADEFTMIRQLPYDLENMSPRDPVLMYCVQHFAPQLKAKLITEHAVMYRVVQYYHKAKQDVQRDSMIIALFSHPDNLTILSEEPEPYEADQQNNDPLILQMPIITKSLVYPTEKRLKRLMDLLTETGAILRVEELLSLLAVRINRFAQELVEVDEGGFQPAAVDGALSAEVQPAGGQREVQKKGTTRRRVSGPDGDTE